MLLYYFFILVIFVLFLFFVTSSNLSFFSILYALSRDIIMVFYHV